MLYVLLGLIPVSTVCPYLSLNSVFALSLFFSDVKYLTAA